MTIMEKCAVLKQRQDTIDTLLKLGQVELKHGESMSGERWNIEELHHGIECNIGIATCDDAGIKSFPFHIHGGSTEYLVCVAGSALLSFKGSINRILQTGECASIPGGIYHSTKPLVKGTKLAYICVPKDKAFPPLTS